MTDHPTLTEARRLLAPPVTTTDEHGHYVSTLDLLTFAVNHLEALVEVAEAAGSILLAAELALPIDDCDCDPELLAALAALRSALAKLEDA